MEEAAPESECHRDDEAQEDADGACRPRPDVHGAEGDRGVGVVVVAVDLAVIVRAMRGGESVAGVLI